ncbi:MAG TPA: YncE family protein [Streptosporangiaceae bacterium]|nr:YncE family protein [Streptosporangiaceae bacterium]
MTNRKKTVISLTAAAVLACAAGGASWAVSGSHGHPATTASATLTSASCHGPAGAAYVADPGYQAFSAVNTATCAIVQTYNVDDPQVPGDTGDYNYTGSDPGIAMSGSTLWFAVAATDNVAAIDSSTLDPSDYSPPETLVPVGYMPQALAATPDGSQVWVVDTGPQTSTSPLWGISVINTSTDKVARHFNLVGDPTDVAFSPDGKDAYVTTSNGLYIYNVANKRQVGLIPGLGSPKSVAVAPDGSAVYVTETSSAKLATISTATDQIVRTTNVGREPWQAVVSANGSTVYVANPDSNSVSVVNAATGAVQNTYTVTGVPDALGLTPNGSQLWVTGDDSGIMTVINTHTGHRVGATNLGGNGANSGDGLNPTGVVLTATPTPGSASSTSFKLNTAAQAHKG